MKYFRKKNNYSTYGKRYQYAIKIANSGELKQKQHTLHLSYSFLMNLEIKQVKTTTYVGFQNFNMSQLTIGLNLF